MKMTFPQLLALMTCLASCTHSVTSPDGQNSVRFTHDTGKGISYEVTCGSQQIIDPSPLGLTLKIFRDGQESTVDVGKDISSITASRASLDRQWEQPWGENKHMREHYNEIALKAQSKGCSVTIRCRAFDDGIGFRYEFCAPGADSIYVISENTYFNMARDGVGWSIPANFETYELEYRKQLLSQTDDANTPFTFTYGDTVFMSIHEAALTDYPEMTLRRTDRTSFVSDLAHWPDGIKARFASDSFITPWRTLQIAPQATGLINSGLILNLNEPCALEDTDWIRPMKYIGIWWGMHLGIQTWKMDNRHGATTANMKRHIDFAAANGIDAVVAEGWNEGWESWGGMQNFDFTKPYADFDIDEVVRYAAQKGVSIIGHHETGGNVPNYERQLEEAYSWYASKGIHAVKTGYAGGLPGGHSHHGQYNVRHYRNVVKTAARYHTVLDVHEPIKPTGIRRTYPNMMTREGAKGMEWNAWSKGNSPEHEVILPFTRLLAGPMDYTPGVFDILYTSTRNLPQRQKWNDLDQGNSRANTTLAKQIANWVILYSPLQMACDLPDNYEGHPAFQFFRDFDPDCDSSQALAGYPGEYIVIVRRAADRYFLGASTNSDARTVSVKADFLKKGVTYRAAIYADAPDAHWQTNPQALEISSMEVAADSTFTLKMAPGGGAAISFIPLG